MQPDVADITPSEAFTEKEVCLAIELAQQILSRVEERIYAVFADAVSIDPEETEARDLEAER